MRIIIITALLTILLGGPLARAQDDPYQMGQSALREERWEEAVEHFAQSVKVDRRADAALYWQAYALHRGNRKAEARRALQRLQDRYPHSEWLDDAQALQLELNGDSGSGEYQDEELRLYAMYQLMERDPERALPLVMQLARSSKSQETRRQALFILGMSDEEQAAVGIAEIARDSSNPELQMEAIHLLAAADSDEALPLLAELYRPDADPRVRSAIIHAHIAADESGPLVGILKKERDPELQREAIFAIAAMDDSEALRGLYPTIADKALRAHVLQALAIAEDTDELHRIILAEQDPDLRAAAIRSLGIADDYDAAGVLAEVQGKLATPQEQKALLETLIMLDDGEEIALAIARRTTDPGIRRQAIQTLSLLEAEDELRELYTQVEEVELRRLLLQQMAIAEDDDALIAVLRTEQVPELRLEAIRGVAIADAGEAATALVALYPRATPEEKQAIIESLMILEEEESLARLLQREQDRTWRRRILEALMALDSDLADDFLFEWVEKDR